jgi:hypothetical protein
MAKSRKAKSKASRKKATKVSRKKAAKAGRKRTAKASRKTTAKARPTKTLKKKKRPIQRKGQTRGRRADPDGGETAINMNGGYRTCGGLCTNPPASVTDLAGTTRYWCIGGCSGDVHANCGCHMYSYPTPAPGGDKPPKGQWQHDWKPGDPKLVPANGRTYECVCVR